MRLTMRAPDLRASAGAMVVGAAAFLGSFFSLELVPSKRRGLVPPQAGNASRWFARTRAALRGQSPYSLSN